MRVTYRCNGQTLVVSELWLSSYQVLLNATSCVYVILINAKMSESKNLFTYYVWSVSRIAAVSAKHTGVPKAGSCVSEVVKFNPLYIRLVLPLNQIFPVIV